MISKLDGKKVLLNCLTTGGDFAEIFAENTIHNDLELSSGTISRTNTSNIYGAGIRILHEDQEVYGYTNDLSIDSLMNLSSNLAKSFNYELVPIDFNLVEEKVENAHKVEIEPSIAKNDKKVVYLQEAYDAVKNYHENISQVIVSLLDETQEILIMNSEGKMIKDSRCHVRLGIRVIASKDGVMQVATGSIGRNQGLEVFESVDIKQFAVDIAESAVKMLTAVEMEGQMLPVVIHNGFGGVILHEACGHSLEATSVAKGISVFSGKLGEKIASDIVTAVDDGTLENYWGSTNIDDEGRKTQRNVLIEKGVLKSYLVDKRNARKMKCESTSSSRRQSYRYSPTSRMNNTYFLNGTSTFEEIIKKTDYGLFAKKMGGGSVNPATGEFNFTVNEGYMIEKGKITHAVRGATLVGSGAEILKKIDMVADNLKFGYGVCGSLSGKIPAGLGQPTIRVSSMTVGGRGGKK